MGYATTRAGERVAAALGMLEAAPVVFAAARDIPQGGVLLAVPALLAMGLLRYSGEFYALPSGFYGLSSLLLLLALMALARIPSIEQLRDVAPGEWGHLLGLDRIPEVRTLRAKLEVLCGEMGRAARWNTELAKLWMGEQTQASEAGLAFYVDGHVRVYHGALTKLPKHYVARQRLYLRATVDYWINALDGQPFFYVNQEVDPGLVKTLREELVPWLRANAPLPPPHRRRMQAEARTPRFTVIFDREGYSPDLFQELWAERIAVLSYRKHAGADWPREEFHKQKVKLVAGLEAEMTLAERGTRLNNGLWVREVRKMAADGQQISIVSTCFVGDAAALAAALLARWCQENFYRYMRQHFGLDALVEFGTEPIPEAVTVLNPAWRNLNAEVRKHNRQLKNLRALAQAASFERPLHETTVAQYEQYQGQLHENIAGLAEQVQELRRQRKATKQRIPVQELPETERFTRLRTERKHFIDTIKMIAYRAETSMAVTVREKLARSHDARALLRQIYNTEVDLIPDSAAQTLTVCLHHLAQSAHDEAARHLCDELTATETVFPGTELRLVYKLGSS